MTADTSLETLHHEYGSRATAVEPGGAEPIPLADRHGKPSQMFWTWVSPNLEFATIFVGIISILFFGLTFWQAVAAIVIGNALGAISQYSRYLPPADHGGVSRIGGRLSAARSRGLIVRHL
jgi:NCS1 family nucleobase:cation symporter-1